MADDNSTVPGAPAGVVTEEQMAGMLGLEVSQIRLMLSGAAPIPPHLEGLIPKPVTQGYIWHAEDARDLPERFASAQEEWARSQAAARDAEERAAAERQAADDETLANPGSLYEFQEARAAERKDAEERFGDDIPVIAPSTRGRARVSEKGAGWFKGLRLANADAKQVTKEPRAPKAPKEPRQPKAEKAAKVPRAPKQPREKTPAIVTVKSNTRRSLSGPSAAPTGPGVYAFDPLQGADIATPESAPIASFDTLVSGSNGQAPVAPTKDEKRANREAAKAERASAKAAKKVKPVKPSERDSRQLTPKLTAAEKTAEKKAAAEAKREDRLASKAAKVARTAAYKEARERWKIDVKVAKDTGTLPPRRPKRPKNDTSKPKPIDIINAVRALATMLENSPGELDAISVMAEEYEGTLIGEAFLRIKTRLVERNASMVQAFAPEKIFPVEVHNMLSVGEKTIAPGPALRTAVKLMDSSSDAKRKLIGEITQPMMVGALSLVALFATAYGVMPSFVDMYEGLEMPVPPVSAAVIAMSDGAVWVLGIGSILAVAYLLWWFVFGRRWDKYRTWIDSYKLHMPLMGAANMNGATYQLIKVLASYINVGAHEREALLDAAAATSNRAIRKHLETTAELMLNGRRTFAQAFDNPMFPNLARRVLRVAEEAGRVKASLNDLEKVFEREAEEAQRQGIAKVSGAISGVSSLIFTVVVSMVTVPPLEMFGSTLSYGQ